MFERKLRESDLISLTFFHYRSKRRNLFSAMSDHLREKNVIRSAFNDTDWNSLFARFHTKFTQFCKEREEGRDGRVSLDQRFFWRLAEEENVIKSWTPNVCCFLMRRVDTNATRRQQRVL